MDEHERGLAQLPPIHSRGFGALPDREEISWHDEPIQGYVAVAIHESYGKTMSDTGYNNTTQALERVNESIFERIVIHYLADTFPELRGLAITGLNSKWKAVPCPVDGLIYISDPEPCWVYVASTTTALKDLRGKWFGTQNKAGDIPKAADLFRRWRAQHPEVKGLLYLGTSQMLGGDADLYNDVVTRGTSLGVVTKVVEKSALVRYLDSTHEGQYVRQDLLHIPANRLSLPLLRQIGLASLTQHWHRFGPTWHGPDRLIPRKVLNETRSLLSAGSILIGLQGASGSGKSMLAHQAFQERAEANDIVLWIPADKIVIDAPLTTTLSAVLQLVSPSLEAEAGQDALRLVAEQSSRLILLVDDINRTDRTANLVQAIEGWASGQFDVSKSSGGWSNTGAVLSNISFLVPFWPNRSTQSGFKGMTDQTSRTPWRYVTVGRYSQEEQMMLAQHTEMFLPDFQRVANALGGDPFLCGLITPYVRDFSGRARSELLRQVFEGFLLQAAQAAEDHARRDGLLVTTYDVARAVDGLIDLMLDTGSPKPLWGQAHDRLGDRQATVLHHAALTNQLGWLVSDTRQATWQWKHTRLRDALIGRRLAAITFSEAEAVSLPNRTKQLLADPGLSEAWALSLVFLPNSTAQVRMIDVLAKHSPLALAHALRLSLFPEEDEPRQALRRGLKAALADTSDRADEFVPGLHTLIVEQLSATDDELVLDVTEGLPDAWDIQFARLSSGDIDVALRVLDREQKRHHFLPATGYRQLETAVEAFARRYITRKEDLLEQLQNEHQQRSRPEAIILLMGYLAWPEFAPAIRASWQERHKPGFSPSDEADNRIWLCHLWSLGRCCTLETKPNLKELLLHVAHLNNERQDWQAPKRHRLFEQPMSKNFGLRWPLSPAAVEAWTEVAKETPDISHSIFHAYRHLEEPLVVEAYIRWYVTAKPFMWGEFTRNVDVLTDPQPLPQDRLYGATVYQSKAVLDRLWQMVGEESDQKVRDLAFEMWKRSASLSELSLLQGIPEYDSLFDTALEVRVRLDDETAATALAVRIRHDPTHWCGYAPRLYRSAEVREAFLASYGQALEQNEDDVADAPRHLPLDAIPDFVKRLRPSLLKAHETWVPLLLTDVPEALSLVQDAVRQAQDEDLEYLFTFGLTQPLTRKMLEALRPVLHRFNEKRLDYLVEHAVESGQGEWVMSHLPDVVSAKDHNRRWLMEVDIRKSLDELAVRVPQGYSAVLCTSEYHDVVDMENRSNTLQDPLETVRRWLGEQPSDAQITVASLAVAERGTASDLTWWSEIVPGSASRGHWANALRLLEVARWNE